MGKSNTSRSGGSPEIAIAINRLPWSILTPLRVFCRSGYSKPTPWRLHGALEGKTWQTDWPEAGPTATDADNGPNDPRRWSGGSKLYTASHLATLTLKGQMRGRILVLDDEPVIRQLVARLLEEVGYDVVTLSDALAALAAVERGGYDLVITNSVMPGMSGARLVARLRRQFPLLPVLHLDDQSHPRAAEFPEDVPTLTKPFRPDILQERVKQLMGR